MREKKTRETEEEELRATKSDFENERFIWLQEQFDEFCFNEASKQLQPEFSQFLKSYQNGIGIWQRVLSELQNSLNEQVFKSWFKPVKFAGLIEENRTLLITASSVACQWISSYYGGHIKDALTKLDLSEYRLSWIVRENQNEATDEFYFYRLILIDNYQQETGITFDEFCLKNQKELEEQFNAHFEAINDCS